MDITVLKTERNTLLRLSLQAKMNQMTHFSSTFNSAAAETSFFKMFWLYVRKQYSMQSKCAQISLDDRFIQVGRTLGTLLQPPAAGRASSDIRPSCSGCSPFQAWKPWRTDHQPGQPVPLPGCPQDKKVSYVQLETLLFQFLLPPIFLYLSRESTFFYWSFRNNPMAGVIYFAVSNTPNCCIILITKRTQMF